MSLTVFPISWNLLQYIFTKAPFFFILKNRSKLLKFFYFHQFQVLLFLILDHNNYFQFKILTQQIYNILEASKMGNFCSNEKPFVKAKPHKEDNLKNPYVPIAPQSSLKNNSKLHSKLQNPQFLPQQFQTDKGGDDHDISKKSGNYLLSEEYITSLMKQHQVQQPILKCLQGHKIAFICVSQNCQASSLHCSEQTCLCSKNHWKCHQMKLPTITTLIDDKIKESSSFLKKMLMTENQIIKNMLEKRENLVKRLAFGNFSEDCLRVIRQIYVDGNVQVLRGRQALEFCELLLQNQNLKKKTQGRFQQLDQQIRKLSQQSQERKKQTIKDCCVNFQTFQNKNIIKRMESTLLSQKDEIFLYKCLTKKCTINLLFRASSSNFSSAKFHQTCDTITHTITILKTSFNKIIGAYTPLPWTSQQKHYSDPSLSSFLISFNLQQKMVLQEGKKSGGIYCSPNMGPCFGGENDEDINICDRCDTNHNSFSNFPASYNYEMPYGKNQKSISMFSGAQDSQFFGVVEYEVFKVQWK